MTIHEFTFKMDDTTSRDKALVVLFHEIQQLELAHNELDARIAAALDLAEDPAGPTTGWTAP